MRGETHISRSRRRIETIRLRPRRCRPHPDTLEAIAEADLITLGPGSLFTSVIPNLLVEGISQAIRRSRAVKAYLREPDVAAGRDHRISRRRTTSQAIQKHAGGKLLDYAIVNTQPIRAVAAKRYAHQQALPVENDLERIAEMGIEVVGGNFLQQSEKVRHDPEEIAAVALRLAREGLAKRRG